MENSCLIDENKKRGRKRKYDTLSDYYHSCNLHTKMKNLTMEKALQQKTKYIRLLTEIDTFIDNNKVRNIELPKLEDVINNIVIKQ